MFKSEKLVRITIQVPEQFISSATGILARFRLLHLIRIDETHLGRLGYVAETDGGLFKEYEELLNELESLVEILGIRPDGVRLDEEIIPEKDVFKIKEGLGEIRQEVDSALNQREGTELALRNKKSFLERFKLLPDELDLSQLRDLKLVDRMIGLVPAQGLDRLEESLSEVYHAFIDISALQGRAVILVFGLKKDWPVFERALKGALFDPIEIPPQITGTVAEIVAGTQIEIDALEKQAQALARERERLEHRFGRQLLTLRERIIAAQQILSARRHFGKIDKSYIISGWIPDRLFASLQENLLKATVGGVVFEKVAPEDLREVRKGIVNIPILFNNPILISPFEKLTNLYGTPSYREIEPTFFFALSFLLMFGMMFGDVGQGGILFFLGYLVFRRFYKYTDYGIILMECGLSSMLFGFLYGSVFGLDTIVPALWFRPMESIPYFVKVTLTMGAAMVSLGLLLNFINALRLGEYRTLFGASGLAGALIYWMSAGLGIKYILTGRVAPGELSVLGWSAAVLMTIIVLHRPLYRLFIKGEQPEPSIDKGAGLFTELMESVVELLDDLIRFVANTVSFIRLAAFALSHAALFIAVFSVANIVSGEKGTGISYWLVVAAGNIIIILLEGVVVSIQTVRLEYYEFFGKFFRGGGEKFKPFDRETGAEERKL